MTQILEDIDKKNKFRPAFSGWPMVIGWIAMLIFAIHACTHMVGAGDTWVAMACGRHFVNHGVDANEPFSANSHRPGPTKQSMDKYAKLLSAEAGSKKGMKYSLMRWWAEKCENYENWPQWKKSFVKWIHPTGWINQNWLTHVIFYSLVPKSTYTPSDTFSSNALVYWKFAIYIITIICVYYTTRLLGVNPMLAAAFACFAIFTGRSYFDVRPAGFSNLLVAVYLFVLVLTTYRNVLYIWLVVPITVFWCNVHGGYLYVFIMLVPFIGLHLLALIPRKWTITSFAILMWTGLYVLSLKFVSQFNAIGEKIFNKPQMLEEISLLKDPSVYIILFFVICAIVIALLTRKSEKALYGFHIAALVLIFLVIFLKFFPDVPYAIRTYPSKEIRDMFFGHIRNSRLFFISIFAAGSGLGIVLSFFKKNLVMLGFKGLVHTIIVSFVSFVAMILFNPFHLTNLTHTFVISVSKHAEMWRNVNEWHPGFEWMNPVGTAYPFLIIFVLGIAIPLLWLYGRFMRPKLLEAPKGQLNAQESVFNIQVKVFGFAVAVFVCWCALLSLSFINYDFYSFLICAFFVGIILRSIYSNVHFVYAFIPFVILVLWSSMGASGYAGRYIYPFVLLPTYFIINIIASVLSKKIKLKPVNLIYVTATAAVSLILMIFIFNPFRFKMPQWYFEKADSFLATVVGWFRCCFDWLWARFLALRYLPNARVMWRPKFINNAIPTYNHLFAFLYIVNILVVILWLMFDYLKEQFNQISQDTRDNQNPVADDYQVPKIDITLITIAALTVYMGVKMRRFIPIAAIAAGPLLALFVDQLIRGLSASINFFKKGKFAVPQMPNNVRSFFIIVSAAIIAYLGTHWTLKFKRIYLDAWPTDNKLTSVFMRMTASDAKPFYALKFIKDNKLEGKMFNYWTEGGFIAWGQQPDPKTGRTPLQLFMDGRAQAAYEPDAYKLWSYIMGGGEIVRKAMVRKTDVDFVEVGKWLDSQLRKYDVWVVLMPAAQFNEDFVRGLETNKNWLIVFFNNKQRLYVDSRRPEAIRLINGILTGETIYPDQFSKDLIQAYYKLTSNKPEEKEDGLKLAIRACEAYPSQVPMEWVIFAVRFPGLKEHVTQFCREYFDDFVQNKNKYKKQDAYHDRVFASMLAGNYLGTVEKELKNDEKALFYKTEVGELEKNRKDLIESKRW